ncbi:mRNA triphosphatase CET1 [Sistotremastrum suecicum HHB10207 ss-3]|nr:mRNA triphosphatase CET1 [Sistotremastrum suecicum HHB10207 ss-3]
MYSEQPPSEAEDSSADGRAPGDDDDDEELDFLPRRASRSLSDASPTLQGLPSANGHDARGPPPPAPSVPLALSILNVEPLDEFIREVADWIAYHLKGRTDCVEVEAKIGVLKDRNTGDRIRMPTLVETILQPGTPDIIFESNMTSDQHRHFNLLLNELMVSPPPGGQTSSPIQYSHHYLLDSFYKSDAHPRDKVRVTTDEKTRQVVQCVRKVKLGDLNIYSPKRHADWRISVNLEIPEKVPTGPPIRTRRKNRMSYTHQHTQIDLTQVTQESDRTAHTELLHELEVEIIPSSLLLSYAAYRGDELVGQRERDGFDELIRVFVNNARILVRNSGSWS